MFEPEYRTGFMVLKREIGLLSSLKIGGRSIFQAKRIDYKPIKQNEIEIKKLD
jgi:hypothetical protein